MLINMKMLLKIIFVYLCINKLNIYSEGFAISGNSLTLTIDGYILSCSKPSIYIFKNEQWRPSRRDLPAKGNYYIDNKFIGYGWCDYLVCNPIEQPIKIDLIEYEKIGEKTAPKAYKNKADIKFPVYKSIPLKGKLKIEIEYYKDSNCKDSITYTKIFVVN